MLLCWYQQRMTKWVSLIKCKPETQTNRQELHQMQRKSVPENSERTYKIFTLMYKIQTKLYISTQSSRPTWEEGVFGSFSSFPSLGALSTSLPLMIQIELSSSFALQIILSQKYHTQIIYLLGENKQSTNFDGHGFNCTKPITFYIKLASSWSTCRPS